MNRRAYCIFTNMLFQGRVLSVREVDGDDHSDVPCVFSTEREAQIEIVDAMIIRLQQFIDGVRDFENAVAFLEEFIVEVEILPDGSIIDADGNRFA